MAAAFIEEYNEFPYCPFLINPQCVPNPSCAFKQSDFILFVAERNNPHQVAYLFLVSP